MNRTPGCFNPVKVMSRLVACNSFVIGHYISIQIIFKEREWINTSCNEYSSAGHQHFGE